VVDYLLSRFYNANGLEIADGQLFSYVPRNLTDNTTMTSFRCCLSTSCIATKGLCRHYIRVGGVEYFPLSNPAFNRIKNSTDQAAIPGDVDSVEILTGSVPETGFFERWVSMRSLRTLFPGCGQHLAEMVDKSEATKEAMRATLAKASKKVVRPKVDPKQNCFDFDFD